MEELLTSLQKKCGTECEEAHRQLVCALNGLAGIHIIKGRRRCFVIFDSSKYLMRKISYNVNQSLPRKTLSHSINHNLNRSNLMESSYTEHFQKKSFNMLSPNISTFRSFLCKQLKQPKCLEIEWLNCDTFKWMLVIDLQSSITCKFNLPTNIGVFAMCWLWFRY